MTNESKPQVNGGLILALGILSFFVCPILGLVAATMGMNAIETLDKAGITDSSDRSLASAGRICGMIGFVLGCIAFVILLAAHQR